MEILWMPELESNNIAINSNTYNKLKKPEKIIVHFGMLEVELKTIINNNIIEGTLGLPMNFAGEYTIPKDITYETYFKLGELYIGPIIAHISIGSTQFRKNSYAFNVPMFLDYKSIKGLIITCTAKSINLESDLIEGYYLDPQSKTLKSAWKYGKFPLPNAMFNHSLMPQEKIKSIEDKIGKDLFSFLQKKLKGKYIIQQEINARFPIGKVDFRVYLFKNQDKEWYLSEIETKIAPKDSIITNHINRKAMVPGEVALQDIYGLNKDKIQQMKDKISSICIKSLKIAEHNGYHFGEAAIDLVIDSDLKIWLLEVQTFFAAEQKLERSPDERRVLPIILPAPFEYAKGLAGFSSSK